MKGLQLVNAATAELLIDPPPPEPEPHREGLDWIRTEHGDLRFKK